MRFLPLIWAGLWRKPGRTLLTLLQVSVAFALFGVLQGMKTGVDQAIAKARANLLIVQPDAFGGAPLPLAYFARLQAIPGVKQVAFINFIMATYQKPTQPVAIIGINTDKVWVTMAPELLSVSAAALDALTKTRTGALINSGMQKRYGWKIGDRIPFTSTTLKTDGSGDWAFDVVGMFEDHEIGSGDSPEMIVINNAYLDEARQKDKGTVQHFEVEVADPKDAPAMIEKIDRLFANSSHETKTMSYRENAQQQMQSIGDLNFVIRAIVSAVLVALLFSTATMMMQTLRERTPELAVLKTLGFTNMAVFILVLAEAVGLCLVAAALGLGLATLAFPWAAKFVPGLSMPWVVIEVGLVASVLVGLIGVALPAARAARLEVVNGLAGR